MKNKFSKRSQAEVITVVILILISLASLGVVVSFVIPFVKEQMAGGDCINTINQISVGNNPSYTCYNQSVQNLSVQIHFGDLQEKIDNFVISVSFAGLSKNYIIKETSLSEGIYIRSGSNFPGKNEERTYIMTDITSKPDSIIVYPVLKNGKSCDSTSHYNDIGLC